MSTIDEESTDEGLTAEVFEGVDTEAFNTDAPLLELDDVAVHFKDEPLIEQALPQRLVERFGLGEDPVQAVDGISLEIGESDIVVLVGESGSGKTTLGRTAIGLQEPTDGQVQYRGYDIQAVEEGEHTGEVYFEDIRRALQIVHQDANAALNPYRTIRATLSEPLKLWYPELDIHDRYERILSLLRTTGVTPAEEYMERYPHELSGGEKQRIAIIRALLVEPDLILADEIVSALDVSLRIDIMNLLLDLQEMFGTSFVFISHNLANARYFASKAGGRIGVVYLGRVVEIGAAEAVITDPKHPYTKLLKWASIPLDPDAARDTITEESPAMTNDPPDPADPPTGCRFHPVCPYARETCQRNDPELMSEDDSGHQAACFRELSDHEYWDSEPIHEEEPETPL